MIPADPRNHDASRVTPLVRGLIITTLVAFVLQSLADQRTQGAATDLLALNHADVFTRGHAWQLLTYLLLHGSIWHLLFNMLVLHNFGREMEAAVGPRRLLALYLVSGVAGGLGWLLTSGAGGGHCIGASGAVLGVMAAFAARDPERKLTFVVFPIPVPLSMKARTMVLAFAGVSILFMFIDFGNVAHAAHLSGGLVGYWYGRQLRGGIAPEPPWERTDHPVPPWRGREDAPDPADVDRILEKVREKSLDSLSARERDVLDRASRR